MSELNNKPKENQQIKLIKEVVYVIGAIKNDVLTNINSGKKNNLLFGFFVKKKIIFKKATSKYFAVKNIVPKKNLTQISLYDFQPLLE